MMKDEDNSNQKKALIAEYKVLMNIGRHVNIQNLLGVVTKDPRRLMIIVEYCRYGSLKYFLRKNQDDFVEELRDERAEKQHRRLPESKKPHIPDETSTESSSESTSSTSSVEQEALQINRKREVFSESSNNKPPVPGEYPSGNSTDSDGSYIFTNKTKRCITTHDLICYAFQCARGMEYLASMKYIHGDLAARNVLLSRDKVIKICDFGLSKDLYDCPNYVKKGKTPLPMRWMAPESLRHKVFTEKTDVWSFGVFLWEVFSLGASPYRGVSLNIKFYEKLKAGYRMPKPEHAPQEIYQIMLDCWKQNPADRPDFRTLTQILGDHISSNVKKYYVDLNTAYVRNQLPLSSSKTEAARMNDDQPVRRKVSEEKSKSTRNYIYMNEGIHLEQVYQQADNYDDVSASKIPVEAEIAACSQENA